MLLKLLTVARTSVRVNILVSARAGSSQMSVVDSWVERDRRSGACELVAMLIDHLVQLIDRDTRFIHDDMVVRRSSSTLDCRMRTQVEVMLERMRNISLNESSRMCVSILVASAVITSLWEEANLVALAANDDREVDLQIISIDDRSIRGEDLPWLRDTSPR